MALVIFRCGGSICTWGAGLEALTGSERPTLKCLWSFTCVPWSVLKCVASVIELAQAQTDAALVPIPHPPGQQY